MMMANVEAERGGEGGEVWEWRRQRRKVAGKKGLRLCCIEMGGERYKCE